VRNPAGLHAHPSVQLYCDAAAMQAQLHGSAMMHSAQLCCDALCTQHSSAMMHSCTALPQFTLHSSAVMHSALCTLHSSAVMQAQLHAGLPAGCPAPQRRGGTACRSLRTWAALLGWVPQWMSIRIIA